MQPLELLHPRLERLAILPGGFRIHGSLRGAFPQPARTPRLVLGRGLVAHAGFEPAVSALRGRCPWPLDECAAVTTAYRRPGSRTRKTRSTCSSLRPGSLDHRRANKGPGPGSAAGKGARRSSPAPCDSVFSGVQAECSRRAPKMPPVHRLGRRAGPCPPGVQRSRKHARHDGDTRASDGGRFAHGDRHRIASRPRRDRGAAARASPAGRYRRAVRRP